MQQDILTKMLLTSHFLFSASSSLLLLSTAEPTSSTHAHTIPVPKVEIGRAHV